MRSIVVPVGILALLASCSPGNRKNTETGMAEGGAGGLSSHDTIARAPTGADSTAADSTRTDAASAPAAILSQLNVANTTEIQLGKLAAQKASSPKVKQIARKLAADHGKNREEVRALAQKLNVDLTAAQGGSVSAADSAAMPSDLKGKSGGDFDRAFIEHEINDHESNINKLQTQAIPSVQNAEVKAFLEKTLTEMQSHLTSLQQVQKQLGS